MLSGCFGLSYYVCVCNVEVKYAQSIDLSTCVCATIYHQPATLLLSLLSLPPLPPLLSCFAELLILTAFILITAVTDLPPHALFCFRHCHHGLVLSRLLSFLPLVPARAPLSPQGMLLVSVPVCFAFFSTLIGLKHSPPSGFCVMPSIAPRLLESRCSRGNGQERRCSLQSGQRPVLDHCHQQ